MRPTFKWIFKDQEASAGEQASWDSFTGWLQQADSSIYWITGKPGSGKSTLMKYIHEHDRLPALLANWADPGDLVQAGFYFWNSGTGNQMSRMGCFRTLLHTCLKKRKELITTAFPDRWEQFVAFGGGQGPFNWLDLRRAFKKITSVQSRKFFFLIDGLDEFDGEPKDIIELIRSMAQSNVKMCVASRPWLAFQDAFKTKPSLLLERLTHLDILNYVKGHFRKSTHYQRLRLVEPVAASALPTSIVNKASGVFLWVYLVVTSLLEGISNSDRMSDLQNQLDALPSDLEALFNKLLSRLQPRYFKQACETFRLIRAHHDIFYGKSPTLLALYFADDQDLKSSLQARRCPAEFSLMVHRAETMRRRLAARCRGFLELEVEVEGYFQNPTVSYFHRTARDFVESTFYWPLVLETTGRDSFEPEKRWANACLWMKKEEHRDIHFDEMPIRDADVIAIYIERKSGLVQKTYLDELCRTYYEYDAKWRYQTLIAVQVNRWSEHSPGYVALALAKADPVERTRALNGQDGSDITFAKGLPAVRYYTRSKLSRWLHARPKLPPYE
ncbi:hypothetical protein N0V83_007701 [Neocucurbitaria cava]|uniref:NACHT domain-containing protein n=1 Tax=Neocucurbitaria cava TaxID=798079 RepID=A0A9W8Y6X2_9PLEO|nr:hypothetical protein N0V83_007701 [Neocucurbitaria cava]